MWWFHICAMWADAHELNGSFIRALKLHRNTEFHVLIAPKHKYNLSKQPDYLPFEGFFLHYFEVTPLLKVTCSSAADKLWNASPSLSSVHPQSPHHRHLHYFCHRCTPLHKTRKQWENPRGVRVWAATLTLLLMSCNLAPQEAMPSPQNVCFSLHLLANGGGNSTL